MAFKEPTYEAVEVGETFGPVSFRADEHYVRAATFSLDDYSDWYLESDNGLGFRAVPSTAIARDQVALFLTKYDPNRVVGLHQTEEVWFHAPVRLGSIVTLTGRYIDKYQRRGKGYVVLECDAHDETGALLVRQISTEIMRIPEGVRLGEGSAGPGSERIRGEWPEDRSPVAHARRGMASGTPVAPLTKVARQDQMAVFSGCGLNRHNIHTDDNVARAAGFRAPLAQGMMETCWISEMLARFFGPVWLSGGWLKTKYLKPVFAADEITLRAVVSDEEADGRVRLEVWATNQDGVMTAAGWASCPLAD